MDQAVCTSELAYNMENTEDEIRLALISMHQFDLIKPIGIRTDSVFPYAFGYGQDILWETSIHTKDHIDIVDGCHGCWVREQMFFTEVLTE